MHMIRSAIAGILALFVATTAIAQTFPTVPAQSVIGRLGVPGQSGPSQAIPFATLGAQLPFLQSGTGAVARTAQSKMRESVSVLDFGAMCDGTTDDTAAINSWLSVITSQHLTGVLPSGTCLFSSPLSVAASNFGIAGAGYGSALKYTGANTTNDLVTIGDGTNAYTDVSLSNFRITSGTAMTGGAAIHLKLLRYSTIDGVVPDGLPSSRNLWHGIWFDGVGDVKYQNFNISVKAEGIRVNGQTALSYTNADLYISNGYVVNGSTCLHMGGAFGGLYTSNFATETCTNGIVVDNAIVNAANREAFFGSNTIIDASSSDNIVVNDTLTAGALFLFDGVWSGSAGFGGSAGNGINIQACNCYFSIGASLIGQNKSDGIRVQTASANLKIGSAAVIYANTGFGVNATVATFAIYPGAEPINNTTGAYSANARVENIGNLSGYRRFPDGKYEQWFQSSFTGASNTILSNTAVAYPLAFPNQVFSGSLVCTPNGLANGAGQITIAPSSIGNANTSLSIVSSTTVTNPQTISCRVSGY